MKLLLVEDDEETRAYIARGLAEAGHVVDQAATGRDGLFMAAANAYDVIVLDRMLPEPGGLAIVRTLRAAGNATPILMLTTRTGVADRVQGLEAGADDYLGKPFAFAELLARVHALGRRPPLAAEATVLRLADLEVDLIRRSVTRGGKSIALQPREFRLLEYLLRRQGQVVTRTMLLEAVWDYHFDPQTNVIDVHVSRLRQKVDKGFDKPLIHTVRNAGYMIRAEA